MVNGAGLQHARDGHPVLGLKLFIGRFDLHGHTLRQSVLHFRFEAAKYKAGQLYVATLGKYLDNRHNLNQSDSTMPGYFILIMSL